MTGVSKGRHYYDSAPGLVLRFRSALAGDEDVAGVSFVYHLHQAAENGTVGTAVRDIVIRYVQMYHFVEYHILDFAFRQIVSDIDAELEF